MGNTLSRCCGRESKPAKRKQKFKQLEDEIPLFEQPKVDSYMKLSLAETLEDVSNVYTHFKVCIYMLLLHQVVAGGKTPPPYTDLTLLSLCVLHIEHIRTITTIVFTVYKII